MTFLCQREKFKNCSKDKAILEPAQGSVLSNGVYDVSITNTIATGDDCLSTALKLRRLLLLTVISRTMNI
jgi:hypothetical protein